jgi:hypothetical protein
VGCPFPRTIAETAEGIIFLGSDNHLQLLPKEAGVAQVICKDLSPVLERLVPLNSSTSYSSPTWGLYDPFTRMYHLFVEPSSGATLRGFVINVTTGEWAYADYDRPPSTGVVVVTNRSDRVEGVYWGDSNGTIFSSNSKVATDTGSSAVTATFRSAPIGTDLPADYKTITQAIIGYTATSIATVRTKVSQDGGTTYGSPGMLTTLPVSVAGHAKVDLYAGGSLPCIELASSSTGHELHRVDITMNLSGLG